MCGEKTVTPPYSVTVRGSPPRVRGKVPESDGACRERRITPACAGKSMMHSRNGRKVKDHPRVCGEKCVPISGRWSGIGSPPRVRGKVVGTLSCFYNRRITPACAGKSRVIYPPPTLLQDHPRVCGEKPFWRARTSTIIGSPPRVRGKVCPRAPPS